jgi:hypothetical protein
MSAITPQRELSREDARVLPLVLLEDVSLHGAADRCQVHPATDLRAASSAVARAPTFSLGERVDGVGPMAVLRNMARIVGAGPLMVIETRRGRVT